MTSLSILMPFSVEFVDTDASGGIHNTAALRWAEQAEHKLLRRLGFDHIDRIPRVHIDVTYRSVLKYGDLCDLDLRLIKIGRTSLSFAWSATSGQSTAFEGHHTAVHVDPKGEPCPLPKFLTQLETQ